MEIIEILSQVRSLLQQQGRLSYRILKLQFQLDEEQLEVLKEELIDIQELAVDKDGKMLVWVGSETAKELPAQQVDTLPPEQSSSPSSTLPEQHVPSGERRQLTVMFCDLVGSTALSEQLDPEELHKLIRAYHEECRRVIDGYNGYIAQYLGDGLLVYFGYPSAHEDDARRAVRAGLDILHQISQVSSAIPLHVRIGLHTGPVVVGAIGQGERREQLALGETPNITARVQTQAAPNTLVISAQTYRLVQGFFVCRDLGQHELKGLSTPVTLYHVQGEGTAHTVFEVSLQKGLTPLVGREEEVTLLRRRWERTVAGDGQVVLLSGEAGIGKSRLLQVLKDDIGHEEHWGIEAGCSPFYQNTALYPVTEQLQRFLQLRREDTAAEQHAKLANALGSVGLASAESLALLAHLLSIPATEGQAPLNLSAQKQKEKTLEVLVTWVQREAARHPVLLVIEDLHWADPSTLELLQLLIERVSTLRVLVVLTFRPEFRPPWPMRGYISTLTLSRLLHQQIELMASRVAGDKALPQEIIDQLVTKTDGVPLFVEELTKSILESDALQEREDHYELIGPLTDFHIPSTLQDSLMARLDRLNLARDIAQFGAVLGREFSYELLQATTDIEAARLQHGLVQLIEAELVYVQGFPPDARYTFKHALVQDAAYESLLKSTRRAQHQRVATVLVERFADTVDRQPELVAHHYTEAGLIEQAIPYWRQAGQTAVERSASEEAIRHFSKGLELLKTLPETPQWTSQELVFQAALSLVLMAARGWSALEVGEAYSRALALCRQVSDTPQLSSVLGGLWAYYAVRAELQTAYELGEQLLSLANKAASPEQTLQAHFILGFTLCFRGEFVAARQHLEKGLSHYEPQHYRSDAASFGYDSAAACLCFTASTLWYLGYPDQALWRMKEAIALGRQLSHPYSLAIILGRASMFYQIIGEKKIALELAEETVALCTEYGFQYWLTWGIVVRAWARIDPALGKEQLEELQQGLVANHAIAAELVRPYLLSLFAEAQGKVGQTAASLQTLTEALDAVQRTGERIWESELYRLKGELLSNDERQTQQGNSQGHAAEAEACFQQAIEIARRQQAKSLELRAATSLGRLWQHQNKTAQAQQLLSKIYHWFTEGFDTQDLQEAKTLLEDFG